MYYECLKAQVNAHKSIIHGHRRTSWDRKIENFREKYRIKLNIIVDVNVIEKSLKSKIYK